MNRIVCDRVIEMRIAPLPKSLKISLAQMLVTVAAMAFTISPSPGQDAASSADPTYRPTMLFDVASVREGTHNSNGFIMNGSFLPHSSILRLVNWQIESIVSYAFGAQEYQLINPPKWPWPTVFVIQARADSEADARMTTLTDSQQQAEQQHMLQSLLEDRFKLKAHWETRQGDVYRLVVAKGGPKLRTNRPTAAQEDESETSIEHPLPPLYQRSDGTGYDFVAHHCPMELLRETLAAQFGRPVIDNTNLLGKYDFVLKYKSRWNTDLQTDNPDSLPPLDQALQQQLGLKVEPSRGPVKVLVIDHIEKPSDN